MVKINFSKFLHGTPYSNANFSPREFQANRSVTVKVLSLLVDLAYLHQLSSIRPTLYLDIAYFGLIYQILVDQNWREETTLDLAKHDLASRPDTKLHQGSPHPPQNFNIVTNLKQESGALLGNSRT